MNGEGRPETAGAAEARSWFGQKGFWLAAILLALVTRAVYGRVMQYGFVELDDHQYILENPHVRGGLTAANVVWAWTHAYASNWHPLTWMSHILDWELFGASAGGHHLTSLLLHEANSVLLLVVFYRLTGSLVRSALVAALFALHPLHVESVAWISERKDVLSAFFWILTIGAYLRYAKSPSLRRRLAVVLLFALGLAAKPMLVTLPFILLLLDYWPLGRLEGAETGGAPRWRAALYLVTEKIPLFILAAISCAVTLVAQRGTVASLETFTLGIRLCNAIVAYAAYVFKMIWPARLAAFYPHPRGSISKLSVLAAALFLTAATGVALAQRKKCPYLMVGWFWYMGTLVPVIGLVQVGEQAMADRYTYLPLVGLFLIAAMSIPDRWLSRPGETTGSARSEGVVARTAASVLLIGVLAALSIASAIQVRYWRDDLTLFGHALDITSGNYFAHNNLGVGLYRAGRTDEAIQHFTEAIQIHPGFAAAYSNLGLALERAQRTDEAIRRLTQAVLLSPDFAVAHNNLANALARVNLSDEAIQHYDAAIRIDPGYADAYLKRGQLEADLHRLEPAVESFRQALRIQPDHADAHHHLGMALAALGRWDEAVASFRSAIARYPASADVHNSLGVALVNRGDLEGAVGELRRAVEIRPQFAEAHENLAWVLMDRGDLTGAWGEVHLAQKYGGELNQKRLQRLTEGMPEPKE